MSSLDPNTRHAGAEKPEGKNTLAGKLILCDCLGSQTIDAKAIETATGTKRRIDQSSCNKDYSCVKGFCPSFVTVHGGELKKGKGAPVGDSEPRQDGATRNPGPGP